MLELILYLALFSIVIISIVTIAARSVGSRTKARAVQNVEYSARYVMERMTGDVRSAIEVSVRIAPWPRMPRRSGGNDTRRNRLPITFGSP